MLPLLAACSNKDSSAPVLDDIIKSLTCASAVVEVDRNKDMFTCACCSLYSHSRALIGQGALGVVVRHVLEPL